ncbi:MAG: hypothetical protein M1814_001094 [Vezdaea aestivalis]|nr:MAG: hypothetical protein M1814_001094 [Vezdaea aestivalis]
MALDLAVVLVIHHLLSYETVQNDTVTDETMRHFPDAADIDRFFREEHREWLILHLCLAFITSVQYSYHTGPANFAANLLQEVLDSQIPPRIIHDHLYRYFCVRLHNNESHKYGMARTLGGASLSIQVAKSRLIHQITTSPFTSPITLHTLETEELETALGKLNLQQGSIDSDSCSGYKSEDGDWEMVLKVPKRIAALK